jgi:hypothetical protein
MSSKPAAVRRAEVLPRRAGTLARKRARRPVVERQVDDRLPSRLPVTAAEIDLLDRMLGSALDAILRR